MSESVLRIRKKLKGKDSLGVAAVINDVGVIQLRRGNTDIAKNCFLEAIRIWKINGNNRIINSNVPKVITLYIRGFCRAIKHSSRIL